MISAAWSRGRARLARLRHGLARVRGYLARFGWRATFQRLLREAASRIDVPEAAAADPQFDPVVPTVAQWMAARFPTLVPLRVYKLPAHERRRVTVVTDSISRGSLFGGVGTALIFGTLLANRRGADLRIVTRTEPPAPASLDQVLQVYGLALEGESQFRYAPPTDEQQEIDLLDDELVVTTSWWTTVAAMQGVPARQLVYLLQEDERMFYPYDDYRVRCERLLRDESIRVVVNTQLLLDHLVGEGFEHLRRHAVSFEPAFPSSVFRPRPKPPGARRRFVFYARPNHARNLFFLGLEAIDAAVLRGVLDPARWEIVFVGRSIPDVALGGRHQPRKLENLDWQDYAELMGSADLGLCLMYSPHPSYPPLDMTASGAVVVSNRHGVKQNFDHLSRNLILCEPEVEALVAGLERGAALAENEPLRQAQYEATTLSRSWEQSLQAVVDGLVAPAPAPVAQRLTPVIVGR